MLSKKFLLYFAIFISIFSISAGIGTTINYRSVNILGDGQNQNLLQIGMDKNNEQADFLTVNKEGVVHLGPALKRNENPGDGYYLYVQKGIRTERVKVEIANKAGWADYVFDENYELISIDELEAFIKRNNRLPGIPTSSEVLRDGLDLAETNKLLLEKIEELNLHVIALNNRLKKLEKE